MRLARSGQLAGCLMRNDSKRSSDGELGRNLPTKSDVLDVLKKRRQVEHSNPALIAKPYCPRGLEINRKLLEAVDESLGLELQVPS